MVGEGLGEEGERGSLFGGDHDLDGHSGQELAVAEDGEIAFDLDFAGVEARAGASGPWSWQARHG